MALLPAATDHAQKKTAHAAEQDRPDVLKRREAWFEEQIELDPARLVFIDETWASTKWRVSVAGRRRASDCALASHTVTGRPRPSSAKLKTLLRKAAERTVEAPWDAIGRLLLTFMPNECANYFVAAGYDAF